MSTEFRIYFDGEAADAERLDLFRKVRVDQAIGLVTEAQLEMDLALDSTGVWTDFEEDFIQPFQRVRIEVNPGDGGFVPLIDGPLVGQRFELGAAPNQSKLTLIVHDDGVLLNRDEAVQVFEDQTASEVAEALFQQFGLEAEVDSVPAAGGVLGRFIVQRGTPMQLLRELARREGMFVYVKPGESAGQSVGVFVRPNLATGELPELLLTGAERNINRLTIEFDALRPATARVACVSVADTTTLSAESAESGLEALGDLAALELVTPGRLLLARTREESNDLDAAVAAVTDFSSWAYQGKGEVTGDLYAAVLSPYQVVSVAGAGNLSGSYLISQVTHWLGDDGYRQEFSLRRNARLESGAAGATGGVF